MSRATLGSLTSASPELLTESVAVLVRDAFDQYCARFRSITRRAKTNFEQHDWSGIQKDSLERFDLYHAALDEIDSVVSTHLGPWVANEWLWGEIKSAYSRLIASRSDSDLAETFFNSVTRKVLKTVGLNRTVEFFRLDQPPPREGLGSDFVSRYPRIENSVDLTRALLCDLGFATPFENLERDASLVAREIDLHLWPLAGAHRDYVVEIIKAPFFRNKVAYAVGRIRVGRECVPLALPLYNGVRGIYVDTALMSTAEVSILFSFAHSYFQVEVERPDELVDFLRSILPEKPVSELYVSIGLNRHAKTVLYRELHCFVHDSQERFVTAPGKEGAVMVVFTLPHFNFVFKVIKDRPCFIRDGFVTAKTTSPSQVVYRYDFVSRRDRVGRMVDTQEFENLRFKTRRFSRQVIREFRAAASRMVEVSDNYVIIRHLYVQRKVRPLPLFLEEEKDPEKIRRVIIDFGFFIKDLAASGIFPSDLFNTWNYGVTRRKRVVLYDYDDVLPLEKANFRTKPLPRDEFEETQLEEEWVTRSAEDFFIDEMDRYSGVPGPLRGIFKSVHQDLYTLEFWEEMKQTVRSGEVVDITPYDRNMQFRRRYPDLFTPEARDE